MWGVLKFLSFGLYGAEKWRDELVTDSDPTGLVMSFLQG